MNRKLIAFLLVLPLLAFCGKNNDNEEPEPEPGPGPDPQDEYAGPVQGTSDWSVIGSLAVEKIKMNWDADLVMAASGDFFVLKDLKLTAADEFKIRFQKDWGDNRGGAFVKLGEGFEVTKDGANIKPGYDGLVDVWYSPAKEQMAVCEAGKNVTWYEPPVDPDADLAPEITNGATILATNRNAEKFLSEVTYPDHDYSYSKVLEYYGGFNGIKYDENGNPDPNGEAMGNPKSDKPEEYTIRWTADASAGNLTFVLTDTKWNWSATEAITAGEHYIEITNLVPNTHYTYSVTGETGKVLTEGAFDTYGHVHQIFFRSRVRNGRDLGGWKTYDGKMVRYRMLYRGGRLESGTLVKSGKRAIANEGIKAQLDLRGTSDVLSAPAIEGMAFCAPVIETGGDAMLKNTEKARMAVQFAIDCAKNNLPMYFHCSLGRDRTGTFGMLMLGILDVIEGDISKEYELTYFAPFSWSVSEGEQKTTPYVFKNLRTQWAYKPAAEYIWETFCKKSDGSYDKFSVGMEKYFLSIGISQEDINAYREIMLVDAD